MKIVYIAKHNSGGNDEEGSISYALEKLGHEVVRIHEQKADKFVGTRGDLLLFHKWDSVPVLRLFDMPKVFWFWDVVEFNDPAMTQRNAYRFNWINRMMNETSMVFMTDGDWVDRRNVADGESKAYVLRQGFDERYLGSGIRGHGPSNDLLVTAIRLGWGRRRKEFIDWINSTYAGKITHRIRGVHGQELANLIANHAITVAPMYPMTDRYWSNRVYLTLGYGGFLLHPVSEGLRNVFREGEHLAYYSSLAELQSKIAHYLQHPEERTAIARTALEEIRNNHTYTQRCAELLAVVERELGVG